MTVFLDVNGDELLNDGPVSEPRTETLEDDPETTDIDETGLYSFTTLDEREYAVHVVVPEGLTQTSPVSSSFTSDAALAGDGPVAAVPLLFDDDELPDLVVVTQSRHDILVHINNGDGTFADGVSICDVACRAVLASPQSLDAADLNGDGLTDLVIDNQNFNRPAVLINNGNGGFTPVSVPGLGNQDAGSVTIGQFTLGDTFLDIAVASEFGDRVYVLRNDGNANFSLIQTLVTGDQPLDVVAADFDNDGDSDLAVATFAGRELRTFILQDNGQFLTADPGNVYTKPTAREPFRLAVGDLDADGFTDVVATNILDQRISVFFNRQTGVFDEPVNLLAGANPASVTIADLNGDDSLDLAVTTLSDQGFAVLYNLGDGTFQTPDASGVAVFRTALAPEILAADVDLDGDPDLLILQPERDSGRLFVENNSTSPDVYRIRLGDNQTISGLDFGLTPLGTLAVSFAAASVAENASLTGTIRREADDISRALTVTLASGGRGQATFPASVIIPAGQNEATFTINGVADDIVDGTQSVSIDASASAQGQRTLTPLWDKDLEQEVVVPSAMPALHGNAFFAGMLLQER